LPVEAGSRAKIDNLHGTRQVRERSAHSQRLARRFVVSRWRSFIGSRVTRIQREICRLSNLSFFKTRFKMRIAFLRTCFLQRMFGSIFQSFDYRRQRFVAKMSRLWRDSSLQYFKSLRFGRALQSLRGVNVPKRIGRNGRHRVLPSSELPNAEHYFVKRRSNRNLFSLSIRFLQFVFSIVAFSGAVSG